MGGAKPAPKLPGTAPAEIAAWRAARRARWPSAALVARKRATERLAGPKGSYASSRWQKRSLRLPQLYAFELAGTEARGKYLDALAAVENSE